LVEYALIVRLTMKSINLSVHEAIAYNISQTRYSHTARIQKTRIVMLAVEGIESTIQCCLMILLAP